METQRGPEVAALSEASSVFEEAQAPPSPADYFTWTAGIGEHYFQSGAGSGAVYLAFDESVATQVGRAFGASVEDFEAAVSSVIEPDEDDPFLRAGFVRNDHIGVLGIVAAQVLAATRMGSFTSDAATAYWKPFQRAFTGDRVFKKPYALEILDSFWGRVRDHYEALGRGRLSIQSDPRNVPLVGKRHINLPLFQALLRDVDRAQIRSWLLDYPEEMKLSPSIVLRHLINNDLVFNKKLAQTLRDAAANKVLAAALEMQLAELMSTFALGTDGVPRRRAAGRLRLVGLGALDCVLQRHNGQRWVDVPGSLDDDGIRHGVDDDASGARWRGDDRILFVDAGNDGHVSHHGAVDHGISVIVLFDKDDDELVQATTEARALDIPLARPIERFTARRFDISEDDAALLDIFSCRLATTRMLRLEGGLSDRRIWLSSCPPRIVTAPGVSHVSVNGKLIAVGNNGQVILRPPIIAGRYVVEAAGDTITFEIQDGSALYDSQDGEEIVYALSPALETCNVEKLTASRYLVGAYLGAKPS
jgi:hypothetical protein